MIEPLWHDGIKSFGENELSVYGVDPPKCDDNKL